MSVSAVGRSRKGVAVAEFDDALMALEIAICELDELAERLTGTVASEVQGIIRRLVAADVALRTIQEEEIWRGNN